MINLLSWLTFEQWIYENYIYFALTIQTVDLAHPMTCCQSFYIFNFFTLTSQHKASLGDGNWG